MRTRGSVCTRDWVSNMIIGISGKARHGKNTIGMFLAMHLKSKGVASKQVGLADELKKDARLYFGWDGEKDALGRFALQRYGSLMRETNIDYWIERLQMSSMGVDEVVYVITDVRYKNEADWIRNHDGFLIRVEATVDGVPIPSTDHISETDLDDWKDWDWLITAEVGDFETLWERAGRVAEWIAYRL